jgi:sodium-dependent dicarboxylate transporter 2/3/5
MDWKTASRMPWDVLLLFGGGLSLAAGLQASGLDKIIGGLFAGMHGVHPVVFLLLIVGVCVFMSEVTSNTAQANVMLPIIAVVAGTLGVNPLLLLIPATMALSCAFMMPMGTPPNALVFSSGMVTIRQMARAGFALNLLTIALCVAMAYTVVPWVTGARFGELPNWARPTPAVDDPPAVGKP